MENKLIINGQEFPVNYKLLSEIAENLPSEEAYYPLAKALLDLDMMSISENLIHKSILKKEDLDSLWDKGDLAIRRDLVRNTDFIKNFTDAQVQEIIELDDPDILEKVASWAEVLYPDDDGDQAQRLSGQMADKLLDFMAHHPDKSVRKELFENRSAPAKFRPAFKEIVKSTSSHYFPLKGFTNEDLAILPEFSFETLKNIANNVEDIEDKKIRGKVAEFLANHDDPGVRLELAENRYAPKKALMQLMNDADADIANAAKEILD